jgi:hypothetical protein
MPQRLAVSSPARKPRLPARDPDPPHDTDEPDVPRWPRALRLVFLLLAGVACWGVLIVLARLAWLRFAH